MLSTGVQSSRKLLKFKRVNPRRDLANIAQMQIRVSCGNAESYYIIRTTPNFVHEYRLISVKVRCSDVATPPETTSYCSIQLKCPRTSTFYLLNKYNDKYYCLLLEIINWLMLHKVAYQLEQYVYSFYSS